MSKILITGGSGFVGTNLVECYGSNGWDILNVDISAPRHLAHTKYWRKFDLRDGDNLKRVCKDFEPNFIFHMGARTDLDGLILDDYAANTLGVSNLIEAASRLPRLERVIFASSMLVCRLGYQPQGDLDYSANTVYGQSKVIGEQLVRANANGKFPWTIVRPTSLWGPWFGVPYRDFFEAVSSGHYVHPRGSRIRRSYGFVGNSVYQLEQLMKCSDYSSIDGKMFYLADYEPIELLEWANLIAKRSGARPAREVPLALLRGVARGGDVLRAFGIRRVPLSTPRLQNLLTEAVFDLNSLQQIVGDTPYDLPTAVDLTVEWISQKT